MSFREIITAKKPALALVPSFFILAMQQEESKSQIIEKIKEFTESHNITLQEGHEELHLEALYACYLGLYESTESTG